MSVTLLLWTILLCMPAVSRGAIPIFYDAQGAAAKVMRMAASMPQWDRRSITDTFGPRLGILYAALLGATAVLCVKVASHLASVPNGAADSLVPSTMWKGGFPDGVLG